jgi:hypothetical protein
MTVHELELVNPDPKYARAALMEPTTLGYLLIAAEVQPRGAPFMPRAREKAALLPQLLELCRQLERLDTVEQVTLFDGVVFAPPGAYVRQRFGASGVPRFDIVVLVETPSTANVRAVQATPEYGALLAALTRAAKRVSVTAARDAKRLGDVDKRREGIFLFNFFVGDDPAVVLDLWDYLAGWYTVETGLDNSTLLVPLEDEQADYVAVNNARWDASLFGVFLRQITKPSFRTYVVANLDQNHVGALPMLYRLVTDAPTPTSAGQKRNLLIPGAVVTAALAIGAGIALGRRRRAAR